MYQRARKFRDLNSINNMEYVDEQIEAYLIAINALALLDPRDAWILVSLPLHQGEEVGAATLFCNATTHDL